MGACSNLPRLSTVIPIEGSLHRGSSGLGRDFGFAAGAATCLTAATIAEAFLDAQ